MTGAKRSSVLALYLVSFMYLLKILQSSFRKQYQLNINRLQNSGYNDARNMFAKYHTAFQIEVLVITKVLIIHFNTYIVRSII